MDHYDQLQAPPGIDNKNFINKPSLMMMSSFRQPTLTKFIQEKGVVDFFQSPLGKTEINRVIQLYSQFKK
mgnify:CR=1 FL=1